MEHYRHGEAVALGMLCVSSIGEKYFNVKNLFYDHIKILKKFRLPQKIYRFTKSKEQILNIILKNIIKDKKNSGVRYVLLKGIYKPQIVSNVDENIVKESILGLLN